MFTLQLLNYNLLNFACIITHHWKTRGNPDVIISIKKKQKNPSTCWTAHSRSACETGELVDFTVEDFTAVSHTTNSILFTSGHPYIPGWVLIWASRDQDRVRQVPCLHDPEQEEEIKKRRKQEVEPRHVRKFQRQELLKKARQVGWEAPRVYQYNLADQPEREAPVVLVPSDSEDIQAEEQPDIGW